MKVHPLLQQARGLCTEEADHREIDALLSRAVDAAKDLEEAVSDLVDELVAERADHADTMKRAQEAWRVAEERGAEVERLSRTALALVQEPPR